MEVGRVWTIIVNVSHVLSGRWAAPTHHHARTPFPGPTGRVSRWPIPIECQHDTHVECTWHPELLIVTSPIHLFNRPSIHSFIRQSTYSSASPFIHLFFYTTMHPSASPFIHLLFYPTIHSSIHFSIQHSTHQLVHSFVHFPSNNPFIHFFVHWSTSSFIRRWVPFSHSHFRSNNSFMHPFFRSIIHSSINTFIRPSIFHYDIVLPSTPRPYKKSLSCRFSC
jgi:hypothetical protein